MASMFVISDDQVLCTTFPSAEQIIVDTVTREIVSTFAVNSYKSIACYRNLHLLAKTDNGQAGWSIKLKQLGQSVPRWKLSLPFPHGNFVFILAVYTVLWQLVLERDSSPSAQGTNPT